MADRITVELSGADRERLASEIFEMIQSMMVSGEAHNYWVPKLLKLRQVADILNMPLSKVHVKVKRGEIPSLRFDEKTIRVDPRELHRYVRNHLNLKVDEEAIERILDESRRLYAISE